MNALVTLLIICSIYYIGYRYIPTYVNEQTHKPFGIFVGIYLIIYYTCVYQTEFTYKMFRNIHDSSQQPLYSTHSQMANAELFKMHNPNANIKTNLWTSQEYRCSRCMNPILKPEEGLLTYTIPLQQGGKNDPSNLTMVCPGCHMFL